MTCAECWVVPNSDPGADWVIIYDADFGVDGGKALGWAGLSPEFGAANPAGAFVTGGGWIDSPAGASAAGVAGKARFGFVARFPKDSLIPTGNTEFTFTQADLKFRSTVYDSLGISADLSRSRITGRGTINGDGDYGFALWAGDSIPDTFRIKIWQDVSGFPVIVYDHGAGQELGGGSIVIHSKKH